MRRPLKQDTVSDRVLRRAGILGLWHQLANRDTAAPKLWMNAYLAAFTIRGAWQLVTLDRDFKTYEPQGLKLLRLNP